MVFARQIHRMRGPGPRNRSTAPLTATTRGIDARDMAEIEVVVWNGGEKRENALRVGLLFLAERTQKLVFHISLSLAPHSESCTPN